MGKARSVTKDSALVMVRPLVALDSRQGLPRFLGISGKTAGATGISLNLVVIPPGGSAEPHYHRGYETAIYILKGRVLTRFGADLSEHVISQAGDFLFIPPDLPHQPINLSATEPAHALVARNDPEEQESVVALGRP
jgi:uncharacterized RmlC-like cupin family protein